MSALIFDAGPIITLSLNSLLWVLPELKRIYGGDFLIPAAVRKELVDRPLKTHKYKLEALQVIDLIRDGTLTVAHESTGTPQLLSEINAIYRGHRHAINVVHEGEVDAIALCLEKKADGIVIDERNTRYLLETPNRLKRRLEKKLHTRIDVDKRKLTALQTRLSGIHVMRTIELLVVAFEHGLLDRYLADIPDARSVLLEGLLWGAKLNGCATNEKEIAYLMAHQRSH